MPHQPIRANHNAYMREYMLRRYHARIARAVAEMGGACVRCGFTEQLNFDHIDPAAKTATISRMWSYSETRLREELAKCQLLCHPCHVLKTRADRGGRGLAAELPVPDGTRGFTNQRNRSIMARASSSAVEQGTLNHTVRANHIRSESLAKSERTAPIAPLERRESPVPLYVERARRALRRARGWSSV